MDVFNVVDVGACSPDVEEGEAGDKPHEQIGAVASHVVVPVRRRGTAFKCTFKMFVAGT